MDGRAGGPPSTGPEAGSLCPLGEKAIALDL